MPAVTTPQAPYPPSPGEHEPPVVPGRHEAYRLGDVMPAPQPKKSHTGPIIAVVVAVTAMAAIGLGIVAFLDRDKPAGTTPAAATSSAACGAWSVDASTGKVVCSDGTQSVVNQAPTYETPTPASFTVTVKVLKKKCFGSAGCNVTYRIAPEYTGGALDPAVTWLVTYEVHGVEDGPAVNTFEVTGDEASFEAEELASTKSSKSKLSVKVTDVARN